jgi:hypothetical protein
MQSAGTTPENAKPPFFCFGDDTVSLPPLLPRRIKRKPIESPTASTVPHNEVNRFSFLSAFLKRLLSNSAINPFSFLKFEKASLCFSAVRSEPFLALQPGRRCAFCEAAGMDKKNPL